MPRPWHLMHVGNLAVSGAGLVIMEATAVEPRGRVSPRCLGLWTDAQAEALRPVVEFCRAMGDAALGIQLAHAGRKGSVARPWEGQETVSPEAGGWQPVSSCDLAYPGRPVPQMLSLEEMAAIKAGFRRRGAAGRCAGLRPDRAACGAWLPAELLPLAAGEPAERCLWRRPAGADALAAGDLRRAPRRLAGGQADRGADLGDRLGGWRLERR